MNIEGIEKAEGKVCTKCGVWKLLEEYHKDATKKNGRRTACKECIKKQSKQHYQNNKEHKKEYLKQYKENNKERMKEYNKQYYENNKEHIKERNKQWRENNPEYNKQWKENNKEYKEYMKEYSKQWRENNPDYNKQWRKNNEEYYKEYLKNNIEHHHECDKKSREKRKENNLRYISSIVERINPIFKQLNLSVYGYVYMFENVKTGHKYVGQSINPLKRRYGFEGGIVKSWIKERLKYDNQKFKEELIEADIKVTEILDVAFCQYHLDKLEAYYIDKYDSYNNGYNNYAGNHNTNDGLEEFNKILSQYNIEFIDGEIKEKRLPKQA